MSLRGALQILHDEHFAVSAVLAGLEEMLARGPGDEPERFFDVLRAMLFYIDEFPERLHHPKESDLLFPKLARVAPEVMPVIQQLEADHLRSEGEVRVLQHLLLAWELLGDSRRAGCEQAIHDYARRYRQHMHCEEAELLPLARERLSPEDWREIDAGFRERAVPLSAGSDASLDRLFTRIVLKAPAPVGVGPA